MEDHGSKGSWCTLGCGHEVADVGQNHYCSYIRADDILTLQHPVTTHPDEYQFVVVHQVFELVFAEVLYELRRIIPLVDEGQYSEARALVERIIKWMALSPPLMQALNTMPPASFKAFRDALAPASGAESLGFRRVEIVSGIRPDAVYSAGVDPNGSPREYTFRETLDRDPDRATSGRSTRWWTEELERLTRERTLAQAFDAALLRHDLSVDQLYREGHLPRDDEHEEEKLKALRELVEQLYQFELACLEFRSTLEHRHSVPPPMRGPNENVGHAEMVKRQIGMQEGSGGEGFKYLDSVAARARFFPELWRFKQRKQGVVLPAPWQD